MNDQVTQLKAELAAEQDQVATDLGDDEEALTITQKMLALTNEHQELRAERDMLMHRLQEAEATLQGAISSTDDELFKTRIDALEREKTDLLTERERLQAQLDDLRANDRVILPDTIQPVLDQMMTEKSRLVQERDRLSAKLTDLQDQIRSLGIEEGSAGLAQLIHQLTEQRAVLQSQNATLISGRDTLLEERARLADRIHLEE